MCGNVIFIVLFFLIIGALMGVVFLFCCFFDIKIEERQRAERDLMWNKNE